MSYVTKTEWQVNAAHSLVFAPLLIYVSSVHLFGVPSTEAPRAVYMLLFALGLGAFLYHTFQVVSKLREKK